MVLRALCIVTGAGARAGDEAVPFLVSGVPCPDVVPVLGSVLNAPELCVHPDAEAGGDLAVCPPVGEPEGNQLVLWGETPKPGVAAEPPSCCCLVRMNPLLPVTEPCGGSVSGMPFSFTNSKVLLLAVAEPCVGLLCLTSSHSVPFSIVSAGGEGASRAAISFPPSGFFSPLLAASRSSFFVEAPLSTLPLARPAGCFLLMASIEKKKASERVCVRERVSG